MNKNTLISRFALKAGLASMVALSFSAMAQSSKDSGPAGVPWGPVRVYPEVDLTFKNDDNLYSQPAIRQRNSSNIAIVAPKVKIEAKDGPHVYDLTYKVEHGRHSYSSVDNYTDHFLGATGTWTFTGRAGLKLGADYTKAREARGSVPGTGAGHAEPDEYHQTALNAQLGYGAEGAQGRVEFDAGLTSKRYDNFQTTAAGDPDNTKRDRDDTKLGATFFWRIAPKTQLVAVAMQTKYDYKPASFGNPLAGGWVTLDSTDRKFQVGLTWEATANTTGIFKVGAVKKDFEDARRNDFTYSGWEGQVKWSPLTYTNFDFFASRLPGESTIGGASRDTRTGVTWNHIWSSKFTTAMTYSRMDTKYQYSPLADVIPATGEQRDKTDTWGLKLNYQWTRTVKFGLGYDRTDKSSNSPTSEYKKNIYSIFMNAAI